MKLISLPVDTVLEYPPASTVTVIEGDTLVETGLWDHDHFHAAVFRHAFVNGVFVAQEAADFTFEEVQTIVRDVEQTSFAWDFVFV